jgi:hypothetical protein
MAATAGTPSGAASTPPGTAATPSGTAGTSPSGAGPAAEVTALQGALAAEHAAVYGYGVVGAVLTGTGKPEAADAARARADWLAHQLARDSLEAMLTKLGATPVAASAAYRLPFPVTSAESALRLAAALENGVTRAYLGVVAVSDPALRSFGARGMQTAAGRAAGWSGTTQAFPGMS